jgi:hypothetical protein
LFVGDSGSLVVVALTTERGSIGFELVIGHFSK